MSKRAAFKNDDDDARKLPRPDPPDSYIVERYTEEPICNPLLRELFCDLRSRIYELARWTVLYEIDPLLNNMHRPGPTDAHDYAGTQLIRSAISWSLVAPLQNGNLAVLEPPKRSITIIDMTGNTLSSFMLRLPTRHLVKEAAHITTCPNGDIAVLEDDIGISTWTRGGAFVRLIKLRCDNGHKSFAVGADGSYYVFNCRFSRLTIITPDGDIGGKYDMGPACPTAVSVTPFGFDPYGGSIVPRGNRVYVGHTTTIYVWNTADGALLDPIVLPQPAQDPTTPQWVACRTITKLQIDSAGKFVVHYAYWNQDRTVGAKYARMNGTLGMFSYNLDGTGERCMFMYNESINDTIIDSEGAVIYTTSGKIIRRF